MKSPSITWSLRLSLLGLLILSASMLWTAYHFKNVDGSPFNPLRNFVSELGMPKSSQAAAWFNLGIIVSSPLFFPLVCILGSRIKGWLGYAAIGVGFCALLGSVGVGFVPMDQLKLHLLAALIFFWGWLGTAFLFTVGFWRRYSFREAPSLILAGILTILSSIGFLAVLTRTMNGPVGQAFLKPNSFKRPLVWDLAILEWCVVGSFVVWVLTAQFYLHRSERSAGTPARHA
ncbi:hypothetical protein BH11VER1_BH11VER1_09280 [soil metagenome]